MGRPALLLPNIFQYGNLGPLTLPPPLPRFLCRSTVSSAFDLSFAAKHIKSVDGLAGCYRGVTPKVLGLLLGSIGSGKVAEKLGLDENENGVDESKMTDAERLALARPLLFNAAIVKCRWSVSGNTHILIFVSYAVFLKALKRDMIISASTIVIAHPFQVVSIRMMAQFVGRETLYR